MSLSGTVYLPDKSRSVKIQPIHGQDLAVFVVDIVENNLAKQEVLVGGTTLKMT